MDNTGKVIISPKFESVREFINGLAQVYLNENNYYIDVTGNNLYTSKDMYYIWNNLLKFYNNQIYDYRSKLTKSSKSSNDFNIFRPYLVINAKSDKSRDMSFESYSENNFKEQSINDLKTLIVKYDYLENSQLYLQVDTYENVTIKSYGTYIIYFDVISKRCIGHDIIRGSALPIKTTDKNDRYNNISTKIASHLTTSQ